MRRAPDWVLFFFAMIEKGDEGLRGVGMG